MSYFLCWVFTQRYRLRSHFFLIHSPNDTLLEFVSCEQQKLIEVGIALKVCLFLYGRHCFFTWQSLLTESHCFFFMKYLSSTLSLCIYFFILLIVCWALRMLLIMTHNAASTLAKTVRIHAIHRVCITANELIIKIFQLTQVLNSRSTCGLFVNSVDVAKYNW